MFTIDLLKGRGIPARSRPEGIVAAAVAMAMPIVVTILLLGVFISNKVMTCSMKTISSYLILHIN